METKLAEVSEFMNGNSKALRSNINDLSTISVPRQTRKKPISDFLPAKELELLEKLALKIAGGGKWF